MLLTPHAIVGVAIGSQIDKAWMVVPLAIGSHFLLDFLPHWERTIEPEDLNKKDIFIVLFDIILAIFLTWLISSSSPKAELMWLGALGATVPDGHHLIHVLFGPEKLARYTSAHEKYHSDIDLRFLPGMAFQLLVMFLAILVVGR